MSCRTFACTCLALLALAPLSAQAQPGRDTTPTPTPTFVGSPTAGERVETSYRGTLLAVDIGTVLAGPLMEELTIGSYLFGAPLVHLVRGGSYKRALMSAGLRASLPVLGALSFKAMSDCRGDLGATCDNDLEDVVAGALVGIIVALAIDYGVLAKKVEYRPLPHGPLSVVPNLTVSREGHATLGLSGSF